VLRIGLTGGLASGKSTVAAHLSALGAAFFDADRIVADLYRPGGPGEAVAAELFGTEVLDPRGAVDRTKLARIVFADPEKRHALESRIHPMVGAEIERLFEEARRKGARVAVAEASQLLEAATENRYDRVLLVVAPEEERIRRWSGKGGNPDDARQRMAAQISPEEARRRAADVLVNDGSLDDLRKKAEALFGSWMKE
jgi:dephospho-CoA kinase